jgi:Iron dependent repressor, N-terminal DNA binding domain
MNKPPARALRAFDKWGEAATPGFQLVPDVLLKNQAKLELSHTDMVVLLNVLMHWWYADKRPFPRSTTIAARMDVQPRTVQRSLARLDELGLVKRVIEELPDGEEQQVCDPSGLRQRLIELAKAAPAFGTTVGKQGDISDVF